MIGVFDNITYEDNKANEALFIVLLHIAEDI